MAILSPTDLENMKAHKYQTSGYTWLDNKMNPYWIKCASYLPYKISPNMVTVIGFFCQLIGMLTIMVHDLTLSKPLPNWTYFVCAFMMFLGQTFDAIDGKHARNTNRSSCLGQLMDHGCDAMGTYFIVIMVSQSHCFGSTLSTFALQLLLQTGFYEFTLEEHFSGILRTNLGDLGVTEYQFLAMGIILLPIAIGQKLEEIMLFQFCLRDMVLILFIIVCIFQCCQLIVQTSKDIQDCWYRWKYLLIFFLFGFTEYLATRLQVYRIAPLFIIILNGNYFGLMASRLIINTMGKRKLHMLDYDIVIYFIGVFLAMIFNNYQIEILILIGLGLWVLARFNATVITVIHEMLVYLKISF